MGGRERAKMWRVKAEDGQRRKRKRRGSGSSQTGNLEAEAGWQGGGEGQRDRTH